MYEITTEDNGSIRVVCRSLDDCSSLLHDCPELAGDCMEEGGRVLAKPQLLGHAEFEVEFRERRALLVFTHRKHGGNSQDKQGRE